MDELKEEILEAVQDATDLTDNIVNIPMLSHFLDGILAKQLPIDGVAKSLKDKKREDFEEWLSTFKKQNELYYFTDTLSCCRNSMRDKYDELTKH